MITEQQWQAFLSFIRANRTVGTKAAMLAAGVKMDKKAIAELLSDGDREDAYLAARGRSHERIRAAIAERAIDGVEEPIVSVKGEIVGYRRVYSDRLLGLMAKAYLPEYRDTRHLEVTGANGGPVDVQMGVDLSAVFGVLVATGAIKTGDSSRTAGEALPAVAPVLAPSVAEERDRDRG